MTHEGPEVEVKASCLNCTFMRCERYRRQGDSGWDVRCEHPSVGREPIGDTTWQTPTFCPFLGGEIRRRK